MLELTELPMVLVLLNMVTELYDHLQTVEIKWLSKDVPALCPNSTEISNLQPWLSILSHEKT